MTLLCISITFKVNSKVPIQVNISAALSPPLDEPFCTHLYINHCINKSNQRWNLNRTLKCNLKWTLLCIFMEIVKFILRCSFKSTLSCILDCTVKKIIKCNIKCIFFSHFCGFLCPH